MKNKIMKIRIENYRGIKSGNIEDIGDINIFVGKNGSGKSSILETIFLTSHNFQNHPVPPIYGSSVQHDEIGTKLNFLVKKRKIAASSGALQKSLQNKNYKFFGFKDPNWWYGNNDKEVIKFIFKMHGIKCKLKQANLIRANEYGIQNNTKKYVRAVYEMPYEWIKQYGNDAEVIDDYKGSIKDEKTIVVVKTKDKYSDLSPWPPEPDYVNYFSNGIYIDSQLMYESSVEDSLWNEIIKKKLKDTILNIFSNVYNFQISSFDHTNEGFWITPKKTAYAMRLDSLGAGMRIGFKLIMILSIFNNTVVLIEEFDAYEHPESLRKIIKTIFQTCKDQNLQFFITTHRMESIKSFLEFYKNQEYKDIEGKIINTCLKEDGILMTKSFTLDYAEDLFRGGIDLRNFEDYG